MAAVVRGFVSGLLMVVVLAGGAVLLLDRGRTAAPPMVVTAARAPKPPVRPPNGDELSVFFCGVTQATAHRRPHCAAAVMDLYRACGLDPKRPKTRRCHPLLRRVQRQDS